jgi:hypothetical protein
MGFDVKLLIGSRFDDAVVRYDNMVVNDVGKPKVQVEYERETKSFYQGGVFYGSNKDEGNCSSLSWEDY